MRIALALCLAATPALSQEVCPPVPDHAAELEAIYDDLKIARDPTEAGLLTDALWRIWTDAPDDRAQELLDRGMAKRQQYDFLGAIAVLDELVAYCPDYAEGYNQRAFASFLRQDYEPALADLDRALALNPDHTGALSGKALTLIGLGREDEAQVVLRQALSLNRWMGERALLKEAPGQDI